MEIPLPMSVVPAPHESISRCLSENTGAEVEASGWKEGCGASPLPPEGRHKKLRSHRNSREKSAESLRRPKDTVRCGGVRTVATPATVDAGAALSRKLIKSKQEKLKKKEKRPHRMKRTGVWVSFLSEQGGRGNGGTLAVCAEKRN